MLTTQIHFICTDFNKLHFFVESETKMCMVQPIICAVVYFSPCQSFLMDRVNWSSYILELWKVTTAVVNYSLCLRVKSYQTPGVWAVYITPGTYCAQWIEYRLSVHHIRNNWLNGWSIVTGYDFMALWLIDLLTVRIMLFRTHAGPCNTWDLSRYGLGQCETTLQCNVVSHSLSPFSECAL